MKHKEKSKKFKCAHKYYCTPSVMQIKSWSTCFGSESKHFKLFRVHSVSANYLGLSMFVYNPLATSKSFCISSVVKTNDH